MKLSSCSASQETHAADCYNHCTTRCPSFTASSPLGSIEKSLVFSRKCQLVKGGFIISGLKYVKRKQSTGWVTSCLSLIPFSLNVNETFFFFFFLQNTSAKYSICDQKKQDNRERAMEGNEVKTRSFQIR